MIDKIKKMGNAIGSSIGNIGSSIGNFMLGGKRNYVRDYDLSE